MRNDRLQTADHLFGPAATMSLVNRDLIPEVAGDGPVVADHRSTQDRVAGALVGAALGSRLGTGLSASAVREVRAWVERDGGRLPGGISPANLEPSADFEMMLLQLEANVGHGRGAPPAFAEALATLPGNWRNAGRAVPVAIRNLRAGVPWYESGVGSFGDGALVRAVADGIAFRADSHWRPMAAALGCVVTHASRDAVRASAVVGEAIAACIGSTPAAASDLIEALAHRMGDAYVSAALRRVMFLADVHPSQVRYRVSSEALAMDTLTASLTYLLSKTDDPLIALLAAAASGRNADTVGALTGALLGALHGMSAFPAQWTRARWAEQLSAIAAAGACSPGDEGASARAPAGGIQDEPIDASHISFLLDRSGSMSGLERNVVDGFNGYCHAQKGEGTTLTLAQFDAQEPFEVLIEDADVASVPPLTIEQYQPRGATPLMDVIGTLIEGAERRLESRRRAGQADDDQLVVIFTDGLENASQRYSRQEIFTRIAEKQSEGWTFVFLGANQDSYAEGMRYSIDPGNTSNFTATSDGTGRAFLMLSRATQSYRTKSRAARNQDRAEFFEGMKEAEEAQ